MATVRMVYPQSRDGMIPRYFGSVNPKTGAPDHAAIGVGILNLVGLFFGKGLIKPIVNTTSLCVAVIFVLICAGALTLRRRVPNPVGFRVPGGTPVAILSIALASAMAVFAMLHPAQSSGATAFNGVCWRHGRSVAWFCTRPAIERRESDIVARLSTAEKQ